MLRSISLPAKEQRGLYELKDFFVDNMKQISESQAKIFELRDYDGETASVGFYIDLPKKSFLIWPHYHIPSTKNYVDLPLDGWQDETTGFRGIIALCYRYLNYVPRGIMEFHKQEYRNPSRANLEHILKYRQGVTVDETEAVNSRLLYDLGFDHYLSLIVMDISTPIENLKERLPDFGFAVTWDFYHGMRTWEKEQVAGLVDVLNGFDKVITYGGNKFDLRVLERYHRPGLGRILNHKSVDLLDVVYRTCQSRLNQLLRKRAIEEKVYLNQSDMDWDTVELTLDSVCKMTLGKGALKKEGKPDGDIYECCRRDVELTRDLFFHILEYGSFSYLENEHKEELYVDWRLETRLRS